MPGRIRKLALQRVNTFANSALRLIGRGKPAAESRAIHLKWGAIYLDRILIDPIGLVRLEGWSEEDCSKVAPPTVDIDGQPTNFLFQYGRRRAEIVTVDNQPGQLRNAICLDYLLPEPVWGFKHNLTVESSGNCIRLGLNLRFLKADYLGTMFCDDVLHRDQIYGSGPPNASVHPDVIAVAKNLPAPILDFGCGNGSLIRALRLLGKECYGLEVESEKYRLTIPDDLAEVISFYDGRFPTSFRDRQFRSVVCSEVLEHIPDFSAAIREIARIAEQRAFFTVPDVSGIPLGYRHGVVPWHLLEGSHLNFFNQQSLQKQLSQAFPSISFGRIGSYIVNDAFFDVSISALCSHS